MVCLIPFSITFILGQVSQFPGIFRLRVFADDYSSPDSSIDLTVRRAEALQTPSYLSSASHSHQQQPQADAGFSYLSHQDNVKKSRNSNSWAEKSVQGQTSAKDEDSTLEVEDDFFGSQIIGSAVGNNEPRVANPMQTEQSRWRRAPRNFMKFGDFSGPRDDAEPLVDYEIGVFEEKKFQVTIFHISPLIILKLLSNQAYLIRALMPVTLQTKA
ncbi:unnamed protein product [Protopolystoma xenopodis]|uniref:Uncharacterized protein n=1 Tax=Protopolystoma xenopodis TaxID=117903 RepID=A0A3S5FE96_9PLAT|nr:unnamed protein product [Protopolystoma xenopodis]